MTVAYEGIQTLTSGTRTSSGSVDIPSGANYALIWAVWWTSASIPRTSVTVILDGQTATTDDTLYGRYGVSYTSGSLFEVKGFSTGSGKTLAWNWGSGSFDEGAVFQVMFFSGVDVSGASGIRDYDVVLSDGPSQNKTTATVTSSDDDLGAVFGGSYDDPVVINTGGQTERGNTTYNIDTAACATKAGSASGITGTATVSYVECLCVSIKAATAAGNAFTGALSGFPIAEVSATFAQKNALTAELSGFSLPIVSASFVEGTQNDFTGALSGFPLAEISAAFVQKNTLTADLSGFSLPTVDATLSNGTEVPAVGQSTVNVAHPDAPGGYYTGYAVDDQHWTLAGSPYRINGNILVRMGSTLTIDPGVQVIFQGQYSLRLFGGIYAVGTSGSHIAFTTTDEDIALGGSWVGWLGIRIVGYDYEDGSPYYVDHGAGTYNFQYCDIGYVDKTGGTMSHPWEDADGAFYAHGLLYDDLIFDNNYIHHSRRYCFAYYGGQSADLYLTSALYFTGNVFEYHSGYAAVSTDHTYSGSGVLQSVHMVGGAARHFSGTVEDATVGYIWDSNLYLDGFEVVDCGDRYTAPWFQENAAGAVYYSAPSENDFTADLSGFSLPSVTAEIAQSNSVISTLEGFALPVVSASLLQKNPMSVAAAGFPLPAISASFEQSNTTQAALSGFALPEAHAMFLAGNQNLMLAELSGFALPTAAVSTTQENTTGIALSGFPLATVSASLEQQNTADVALGGFALPSVSAFLDNEPVNRMTVGLSGFALPQTAAGFEQSNFLTGGLSGFALPSVVAVFSSGIEVLPVVCTISVSAYVTGRIEVNT